MRRPLLAAALGLALAGCSNGQFNPIVEAVVTEIVPGERAPDAADRPAQTGPLSREQITRADVATIRARLLGDQVPTYLFGASDNGGYVTFASGIRQTLTLRGNFITASRGLGWDLLSAVSSRPDPLVNAIPPGQWPTSVQRSYEFSAFAPQGRIEAFECRFEFGDVQEVVILQVRHRGVEVTETCANDERSFENLYLADVDTGFVWRSIQWLGPQQGLIDLEIVEPYTGRRG
jgi:hypothetical protein